MAILVEPPPQYLGDCHRLNPAPSLFLKGQSDDQWRQKELPKLKDAERFVWTWGNGYPADLSDLAEGAADQATSTLLLLLRWLDRCLRA